MVLIGILLGAFVALLLFGFVGGIARAIVGGGREDRSIVDNAGLGFVGSLVGGTLWNIVNGRGFSLTLGGFLASLIGSVVVLLVINRFGR